MRKITLLILAAFLVSSLNSARAADPDPLVAYTFRDGEGDTISDVSGVGDPLDLIVEDPGNISWMPGGGLRVHTATLAKSAEPATKIIEACKASNEITIVAWVRPDNKDLAGPARIVSCSVNQSNRNFTLGQDTTGYQIRLRTTTTGNNGYDPPVRVPDTVFTSKVSKLAYTRNAAGEAKFYIDGDEAASETIPGDMSNWDDSYLLGIAHELSREEDLGRFWLGEYYFVAVYSRALTQNEVISIVGAPVDPRGKLPLAWAGIKTLH